ncbi:MAG TPA: squalene/phytoene synthase family protein [Thermoanaerobaculia bacterium]|nr:squalene/phytoene synthase family protein [Thermoanaerobaculia bacterium]
MNMPSVDLEKLLEETSRTFALSIPLLPEPTRREVTIAYLLFRIADTFEDASHWSIERRVEALAAFRDLLTAPSASEARRLAQEWGAAGVSPHEGYARLIAETPEVLEAFFALSPGAVGSIRPHVQRSTDGMAGFVRRTGENGELSLRDVADLKSYCYVVAGIVGEMLTDLFLLGREALAPAAPYLVERAATFGEALQLVNILKDSESDALEGRRYLPPGADRAEVFLLARSDLNAATEYILKLREAGAPRGLVAFTALPVLLAWAALEKIEREGPGSKVSRPEVFAIAAKLELDLAFGRAPLTLRETAAAGR